MQAIFDILGKPQGKGRPRFARNGKPYTPAATAEYETRVANLYMNTSGQYFGEKPLRMILNVFYEVPKSTSKRDVRKYSTLVSCLRKSPTLTILQK